MKIKKTKEKKEVNKKKSKTETLFPDTGELFFSGDPSIRELVLVLVLVQVLVLVCS